MAVRAILIDAKDNVATVIGESKANGPIKVVMGKRTVQTVRALKAIPFGHKVALADLKKGDTVVKYGVSIGSASKAIRRGDHVHVQNMESNRGRGDLVAKRR